MSVLQRLLNQLRTDPPRTGRIIAEDGVLINQADEYRLTPENIARGKAPGSSPFGSFGVRATAGEANWPVWPNGPVVTLPQLGAQMTIVSTSANDSAAGSNVRSIEIHYLDRNLDPKEETVIMAGLTPVLTVADDIRWIQCMHLTTFGATASAAGIITAKYGADTFSQINAGKVRCSSSFRMVPRGKLCYVDGAVGSSTSLTADTATQMSLVASELDDHRYHDPLILIPFAEIGLQNGTIGFRFPPAPPFHAGTLIGGLHTTNKAGTVAVSWFGRLEPDPDYG